MILDLGVVPVVGQAPERQPVLAVVRAELVYLDSYEGKWRP